MWGNYTSETSFLVNYLSLITRLNRFTFLFVYISISQCNLISKLENFVEFFCNEFKSYWIISAGIIFALIAYSFHWPILYLTFLLEALYSLQLNVSIFEAQFEALSVKQSCQKSPQNQASCANVDNSPTRCIKKCLKGCAYKDEVFWNYKNSTKTIVVWIWIQKSRKMKFSKANAPSDKSEIRSH